MLKSISEVLAEETVWRMRTSILRNLIRILQVCPGQISEYAEDMKRYLENIEQEIIFSEDEGLI